MLKFANRWRRKTATALWLACIPLIGKRKFAKVELIDKYDYFNIGSKNERNIAK